MRTVYHINGMTCGSCKAIVETTLAKLPDIQSVSVDMAEGKVVIDANRRFAAEELNEALPGKYTITAYHEVSHKMPAAQISNEVTLSKWKQLYPLFLIFAFLLLGTILGTEPDFQTQKMMLLFMGLFYLVFSFFKLLDLKGFAESFAMYDPIAAKNIVYAKAYPFIELFLGILFLLEIAVVPAVFLSLCTLVPTTLGVTKTLLHKRSIKCACLGTMLKLPMTEATFIENAVMIVLGIAMLC